MEEIDKSTMKKFNKLKERLKEFKKVLIAYSGGVDSSFLLASAREVLHDNFLAVLAKGPIFPSWETKTAIKFLKDNNINFKTINYNPLSNSEFINNTPLRCYYCKKYLFTLLKRIATENGYKYIIEGTNLDDLKDYRPGLRALNELNILSPLKEAGLSKDEIRKISKYYYKLSSFDLPSMACLATRIPYYDKITAEKLNKVEKIEKLLLKSGFTNFRARLHGNLVRIEVLKKDFPLILNNNISKSIIQLSKNLGFTYITIDLEGYKTGSLNEEIRQN